MTETSNILHHATTQSLVLMDEVGRGTSTFDGLALAHAIVEQLLQSNGAYTLFATHYWELTELELKIPGATNYCVAVHETEIGISFLHKIVKGSTDKSYGIHVGKLAGLPISVLKRASEILLQLEKKRKHPQAKPLLTPLPDSQMTFLVAIPTQEKEVNLSLIKELQNLDPNHLSPIEALQKLLEWKEKCPRLT